MELTKEQIQVKNNEFKIKFLLNNYLKNFYELEKENLKNNLYDWRSEITETPIIDKIDYETCDISIIQIKYPESAYEDSIVFFEHEFLDWLKNQNDSSILIRYNLSCEDYSGIFIEPLY